MVVQKGTGFYHEEAVNTNRITSFSIVATGAVYTSPVFLFLKGNNAFPPWIGQNASPTVNQKIAQYRADYVIRFLSIYAIPVATLIFLTTYAGDSVKISYETYISNVLPSVADIVDTLGIADRPIKTKPGLQTLATNLVSTASLDGGATLLFAANPNLSDGTPSTAQVVTTLTVTALGY
jgi:hypothetical protein